MQVEGKNVKVGDIVGFKSDTEQSGRIIGANAASNELHLEALSCNGFRGEYIHGMQTTWQSAHRCWID